MHLSYLHILDRLLLNCIKRMRLVLDIMEIDVQEIYTAYIAVPGSPVIKFHRGLVGHCSELSRARKPFRNILACMLCSDRNIEIVENMECLNHGVKACIKNRSGCLIESGTDKS